MNDAKEEVPYQEPLDDATERLITHVRGTADNFGRNGHNPGDFRKLESATDALRNRIRELVAEARKNVVPGKLPEETFEY